MAQKTIYFYPITSRNTSGVGNPYTDYLLNELGRHFKVLNRRDPSAVGILNLFKYLNKTDILFLNWIEDLPDKKYGYIQTVLFFFMLRYLKLRKASVCWVLHNKFSHYRKNRKLKSRLFRLLATSSTHIITHSEEGLNYLEKYDPAHRHNILFFHHPVVSRQPVNVPVKKYDILIWGSLIEYKGVDKFLEYLYNSGLENEYRILIAGKIFSSAYREKLLSYSNENIHIEDGFIDDTELYRLIGMSKMVLFTYRQESVLSSGALMDSLSVRAIVAGPDTGAFRDLGQEGLVVTYSGFEDLVEKAGQIITDNHTIDRQKLESFIDEHSWEAFGLRLADFLQ